MACPADYATYALSFQTHVGRGPSIELIPIVKLQLIWVPCNGSHRSGKTKACDCSRLSKLGRQEVLKLDGLQSFDPTTGPRSLLLVGSGSCRLWSLLLFLPNLE
jgi:hypothetical protein